jgi:hypothetical protein
MTWRRGLAAAFALVGLASIPSRALAAPQVVVLGKERLAFELPDGTPRGSILLIPGGGMHVTFGDDGVPHGAAAENFVIRTRAQYLAAGYAIGFLDDPNDVGAALAKLRTLARPVAIVATSRGTIRAAASTLQLGADGPDLLVLTSPVTVGSNRNPDSLAGVNVAAIRVPTLVTANAHDRCDVSPPSGAARLAQRIPGAAFLTFSSTAQTSADCDPLSPHGYLGIEGDVVGRIVQWLGESAAASRKVGG